MKYFVKEDDEIFISSVFIIGPIIKSILLLFSGSTSRTGPTGGPTYLL